MTDARSYRDALEDIGAAARNAQAFVRGMSFEEFCIVRALELTGEAAKQIPDS